MKIQATAATTTTNTIVSTSNRIEMTQLSIHRRNHFVKIQLYEQKFNEFPCKSKHITKHVQFRHYEIWTWFLF